MAVSSAGIREVGYVDCGGGGQIVVEGDTAFVGHTVGPDATSIIDVADPKNPKVVNTLRCKHTNTHAHKVRIMGDLMLTNYESIDYMGVPGEGFRGGLNIYDISDPRDPKHIHFWDTEGEGVHRFTVDDRYAYLSATAKGFSNHIVQILDLKNPTKPEVAGRWWWPGQWHEGGEEPEIPKPHLRCHHPIRQGDRLYTSYWHAGWAILDISDMANPRAVSKMDWSPPFPCPSHTCLPIPFKLQGMDIMLVADEDVQKLYDSGPAFIWMVNISDETRPVPFASFQVEGLESGVPTPPNTGCHQPVELVRSTEIPVAWFAKGLRVVDIANPHAPKEVAHYIPEPAPGKNRTLANDVFEDDRRLIYLIDREHGLHILERT